MTMPGRLERRLAALESALNELDDMLLDMERLRDLSSDDPQAQRKLDFKIKEAQESISRREQEYAQIQAQLTAPTAVHSPTTDNQLKQINDKLDALKTRLESSTTQIIDQVKVSEQNVTEKIAEARAVLLKQYDTSQQQLMGVILNRLDENQLEVLQSITTSMDKIKPGEAREDLSQIMSRLEALEKEPSVPGEVKEEIKKVKEEVDNQDGAKAGLKLALPLIPGILDISTESLDPLEAKFNLNLGVLKVDASVGQLVTELKSIWQRFRKRAKDAESA